MCHVPCAKTPDKARRRNVDKQVAKETRAEEVQCCTASCWPVVNYSPAVQLRNSRKFVLQQQIWQNATVKVTSM